MQRNLFSYVLLTFVHLITSAAAKSLQSCLTLTTPWTAAYQVPPSMGFSRQKYWSGVPLPSTVRQFTAAAAAAKSLQSCPTLCDPIDGSPPGSSVPGSGLLFPSPMHESEK